MDTLFALEASAAARAGNTTSAIGTITEHLAIAELLRHDHLVAIPVVDIGVDLIVNYQHRIQVKTATPSGPYKAIVDLRTGAQKRRNRGGLHPDVTHLLGYDRTANAWYVIPRKTITSSTRDLERAVNLRSTKYAHYRDAWNLLERT